ncbi:MAG: homoserine dehydrogenase [Candidatus Promineifilaceae bacterium]|jgi:homoserine dehydrogenase
MRLALIGFGNVGQGFAEILVERGSELAQRYGLQLQIVAVSDLFKGSVYNPQGLDPADLLTAVRADGNLDKVQAPQRGWNALETIRSSNADVIIELSYTDLETGQPALDHIRTALQSGKHVITSNKGPVALHYQELKTLADQKGLQIGIEGTVMSGTPALRLGNDLLAGAGIQRIQGILNGTTNYILTRMEAGASYTEALADAQALGYAEADPTGDVEGFDAAGKAVILANLLLDAGLKMADVQRTGISKLTPQDIIEAAAAGERWKLIALVEQTNEGVRASVQPLRLPLSHPLASVSGATNAITYSTDLLGDVTLFGPGAGRAETGYAIVGDLLAIHKNN